MITSAMRRKKSIQIHVPQPCQQPWSEMRAEGNGRFCDHCQQTVIDYTAMGDSELARELARPGTSTCGRFRRSQLNRPIVLPADRAGYPWPRLAAGAALLILALPHALLAQSVPNRLAEVTVLAGGPNLSGGMKQPTRKSSKHLLSGTVINAETGEPIQWAAVGFDSITDWARTDSLGRFSLMLPLELLPDSFDLKFRIPHMMEEKRLALQQASLPSELTFAVMVEEEIITGAKARVKLEDIGPSVDVIKRPEQVDSIFPLRRKKKTN